MIIMDLKGNKKEIVFGRMKQAAAKLWGYQESETDGFDPVIDLLFGAFAAEFEKLSSELYNSQSRILEKVSQILLPEVNLRPVPSYAIVNVRPLVTERYTKQSDQFITEKEFKGISTDKPEIKKVYFSPVPGFRQIDAEILFMATSHEIIQINDLTVKNTFCQSKKYRIPHINKLWLGMAINPAIDTLKDVSFYFDWFNNPERKDLLKLLQRSRWSINKNAVTVDYGYSRVVEEKYNYETMDISSFLDINLKTEKKIIQLFEEQYITITQNTFTEKQKFPDEFEDFFESDDLQKIREELTWIEIEFPEIFPMEYLSETFCTPTAVPMINRRMHDSNRPFRLNKDLNILPLITEDYFLSIKSIISSGQTYYQEVPFKRMSDFAPATFTVRSGGIKRFDERDANDFIQYLNELLREEHVAFKSVGTSFIEKELNDLQIIINRLQLSIQKSNEIKKSTHFVILKSENEEDVWLEFWSTTGSFGNDIAKGSLWQNADFNKKTLKLITATSGGKNPPDAIDRTSLFKKDLLARDRVVTKEDIKAVCFAELGHELRDVLISRSPIPCHDRNSGFQNGIHIRLIFAGEKNSEEKDNLIRHMESVLETKSTCLSKYLIEVGQ